MSFRTAANADILIAEMKLHAAVRELDECRDALKAGDACDETMHALFNVTAQCLVEMAEHLTNEIMDKP